LGVQDSQGKEKRDSDLLLPSVPVEVVHRVTAAVLHLRVQDSHGCIVTSGARR
jgi:hypothetical protein